MQTEGKQYICDRCGKANFVKYKEDVVRDGGYTRTRIYEKPDGWTTECINNVYVDLCPECTKEYTEMTNEFLKGMSVEQREIRMIDSDKGAD